MTSRERGRKAREERAHVDQGVEVEGRQIGVLGSDVDVLGLVVDSDVNSSRKGVVEVREGDLVLGSDLLSNDDLVDVVELVPVFVEGFHVLRDRKEA